MIAPASLPSAARPWIKVCGIRSGADLEACARSGATHVGINTWPGSPRAASPNAVAALVQHSRRLGLASVLLHLPGSLLPLAAALHLHPDFVQVSQPPDPALRQALASAGIGLVESRPGPSVGDSALPWGQVLLLDSSSPHSPGGTGKTLDWTLASRAPRPFVLAGGLGPDNVADGIATCRPVGVDAASRLESRAGRKDPAMIRDYCVAARHAFNEAFQETRHAL